VGRESAVQKFDPAAKALSIDWGFPVAGRQMQRWAQAIGGVLVTRRDREVREYRRGIRPSCSQSEPALLVIGLDGGRVQGKDKDADSGSR